MNWRNLVKFALFVLIIEGALRKWFLPQAKDLIYFLKDFFLLGAYFLFLNLPQSVQKVSLKNTILKFWLVLVSIWLAYQAFNPRLGSPLVGIMGIKGYLWNVPLIWMVFDLFDSEKQLFTFLRNYLLLTIPVAILGVIQFFSPINSPINTYVGDDVNYIANLGIHARITATFSYIDPYVVYLIVSFGLLVALLEFSQSKIWKIVLLSCLFLVSVNSFMTGSRSCVFASVLFLGVYIITNAREGMAKMSKLVSKLIIPLIIIAISAFIWFNPAIEAFWLRTQTLGVEAVTVRTQNIFTEPFHFAPLIPWDGYGTGATQGASKALRNRLHLPPGDVITIPHEEEPERILLELGFIGFFLWYALKFCILMALWQVYRELKRPFLKQLALSAFLIQLIQFPDQLVTQHVFSLYYWFLTGFIYLLPRLESIENEKEKQKQRLIESYNDQLTIENF